LVEPAGVVNNVPAAAIPGAEASTVMSETAKAIGRTGNPLIVNRQGRNVLPKSR